jgi:hypothetical protein
MARHRERRRRGVICFRLELEPWAIAALVELGWLADTQRDDHAAIVAAFCGFAGSALTRR